MITCSRCGNVVASGQSSCQYCGMPVMNRSEYGANAGKASQDQPELPAWLQSLRAGTQPTYTTGGNANFSASDLVEEGALPGWMKPGQPGQPDAANSLTGPHAALRPSSASAPNTDGSVLPVGNMSASSLIDEQSLPSWMREQSGDRQGLSAASLVQPEALPDWLRDAQAGPQPPQPFAKPVSGQYQGPQTPPVSPSQAGVSQGQPVPSGQPFLEQSLQSPQPPMPPFQPLQSPQSLQSAAPQSVFPQQGLSARDLVDPQALPPWLSGQPGTSTNGEGLPAASLLDMNALPPWLRQNDPGSQGPHVPQPANPPAMNMNGSPAPMPPAQSLQSPQPPMGNLVAASFIDMDALPDWLRSASDGQGPDQSRFANGGIPPRVENVRVPGRPRGGAGPQEASEAAANVFASMLGVASNAPQLSAQPQQPSQGQGAGLQGQPSFLPAGGMAPGQTQGQPGPVQGYGPQGYQAGPQGQPGYPAGSQPGVAQPLPNQGMPLPPGQPVQSGQPGQVTQGERGKPAKPARRGFLDTIREWFGFNS